MFNERRFECDDFDFLVFFSFRAFPREGERGESESSLGLLIGDDGALDDEALSNGTTSRGGDDSYPKVRSKINN
jgi:hypothetical protein